jgi:hypothetical protein
MAIEPYVTLNGSFNLFKINSLKYFKMFVSIIEKNVNISEIDDFIKKYNLIYIGKYKSYDIQNVRIISNKDNIDFYKVRIIDDEKYIMEKYIMNKIMPFSFHNVDMERVYELYKNDNYILKSYINYFDIELINY